MSALYSATALVVPFENLRMSDVESVGGKNASLGEMISQLSASGVRVSVGWVMGCWEGGSVRVARGVAHACRPWEPPADLHPGGRTVALYNGRILRQHPYKR